MNNNLIRRLANEPRKLFLLDGIGALASFASLLLIAEYFSGLVGMPRPILQILAGLAACFFVYSSLCFMRLKKNHAPYLQGICLVNSAYCLLTLSLTAYFYPELTAFGVAYFSVEICLICILVYTEWRVFRLLTKST